MTHHRLLDLVRAETHATPAVPAMTASGFVAFPLVVPMGNWAWQQQIYQLAYEQARAVTQPSRLERWLKVNPN